MGLVRLLSMGKTFGAATNQPRRYQALPGRGLPKLRPATRPAQLDTAMKKTISAAGAETRREAPLAQRKPGDIPAPAARPPRVASARVGPKLSWWQQAGAFFLEGWSRKTTRTTRLAPSSAGGLVQQELALEHVKPCRNDLSDADWEMVPLRPSGARRSFFRKLVRRAESGSPVPAQPSSATVAGRV
jgi:hypothetical protein